LRGGAVISPGLAVALGGVFVALTLPLLGTLPHDFDEAWLMLDGRFVARGARPFADFAHHELPLHLYLLALFGKVFGETVFGYRMLSLASVVASGLLVFALARPFVGPIAALVAQAVFLFSPLQARALTAVPESPMVAFSLLGAVLLFTRASRWSAYASGAAFVGALLIKPTCLPMVAAGAASLALARDWRRLRDLTVAGVVAAAVAFAWVLYVSDGVFGEVLLFQIGRIGTQSVGMWSIDSGFADLRRLAGIETPWQLALRGFADFYDTDVQTLPVSLFVLSLLAVPIWVLGCARQRPALRAFAVLWPASYLFVNFVALDFVSLRYFVPFVAFTAFLVSGWVWLVQRYVPSVVVGVAAALSAVVLALGLRPALARDIDPWYWRRLAEVAQAAPRMVSFSAMQFAATGTEPGCGMANAALTYGGFGEAWLVTDRTRRFRFSDERVIACLRADPEMPIVVDWAFYFFTRPGSPLRRYLSGEGARQRLFFSSEAIAQWDRPQLLLSPLR
jgi:4-amino-4-deoxy-L-arabinose transferase-like glycosyltransferase